MKKLKLLNSVRCLALFALITSSTVFQGFSQNFTTSEPDISNFDSRITNGENPIVIFVSGGTTINYLFSSKLPGGPGITFQWTATNQIPAATFSFTNSTSHDATLTATIVAGAKYTFTITLVYNTNGTITTNSQDFELHLSKPSIATSLVLDHSGSMLTQADMSMGASTDSRLTVLSFSVNQFLDFYSSFSSDRTPQIAPDQIGAIYFNSTATADALGLVQVGDPSIATTLEPAITGLTPTGSTAMGQGVQQAMTLLPAADPSLIKNILLFTDGIQNVDPKIHAVFVAAGDPGNKVYFGEAVPVDQGLLTSDPGLKISAIAMSVTTPYFAELQDITKCTGGYFSTVVKSSDFSTSLQQDLAIALKSQSPQVVEHQYGTVSSQAMMNEFDLNSGIRKVVLELFSTDSIGSLNFSVEKDGVDVTSIGKFIRKKNYILFSALIPNKIASQLIISKGKWKMKITGGRQGQPYRASALVDDHGLKYSTKITDDGVINKPLKLDLALSYNSKVLTNVAVTAIVLKPGQDLGTLLATTDVRKTDRKQNGSSPDLSPGNSKLQMLLTDSAIYNSLLPKSQLVTLASSNDGTYSASFANTNVTGPYQVIFLISGSDGSIGKYIRTEAQSTVLELDEVNLDESSPSVQHLADTLKITIRPRSTTGLYLGPDYGNQIKITSATVKFNKIIDHVDGSYTIVSYGADTNPKITLTILGQTIYEGNADDIVPLPWWKVWWIWLIGLILLIIILRKILK